MGYWVLTGSSRATFHHISDRIQNSSSPLSWFVRERCMVQRPLGEALSWFRELEVLGARPGRKWSSQTRAAQMMIVRAVFFGGLVSCVSEGVGGELVAVEESGRGRGI